MTGTEAPTHTGAPWVMAREGEHLLDSHLLVGPTGLRYRDEGPYDRDDRGALWARWGGRPTGRVRLADAHGLRQRRALRQLLCQGCKRPADRTGDGTLWLIEDDPGSWDDWPEQLLTMHPPTCMPCAAIADRACPHLSDTGSVLLYVKDSEPAGIRGHLYTPTVGGPPTRTYTPFVDYRDPRLPFALAVHQVVALSGCTIVRRTPPRVPAHAERTP